MVSNVRPARVLLVEDDRAIARLLEYNLVRAGYQVAIAQDGEAARSRSRSFEPDAVILDLNLPDMSGVEVLKRIRNDDGSHHRVVLILSYCTYDELRPRLARPMRRRPNRSLPHRCSAGWQA